MTYIIFYAWKYGEQNEYSMLSFREMLPVQQLDTDFKESQRSVLLNLSSILLLLLLSRSRLCHYTVGGAWWHLCFYESF
jgi:hypothetical protein